MKYKLGFLDDTTFNKLKELVTLSLNNINNPKLGDSKARSKNQERYLTDTTFIKPNKNIKLVNLVNSITGYPLANINSFFHVRYNTGDCVPLHRDRSNFDVVSNPANSVSFSFLLNMCEEGGEFILDGKILDFNIPGQYVSFNGQVLFHEIKQIKKGTRDALVVWYSPKVTKSIL